MNTETQQPHFDEEAINRFLSNEFTDEEARRFEQHLDACEPCQQRMTKLSANHWGWGDVSSSLEADEFDLPEETSDRAAQDKHDAQASGADAATDSLAGASCLYSSTSDDAATTSGILKREISGWLDPTDEPHMLGRFAGYEIVGIIGHGGMGIVLKGFEPRLNRFVAIKILAPRLASSGAARKRFEREARAAAAVLHDNVIAIHRVDYWHDLPFLVMPYIAGESLQQRIDREGPLEVEAVLRIGQQIAAGLSAAHAQGLVHRDIKPANILLDKGVERVTITDFGLARASDDAVITQTGFVAGTPQYMSPEQASGLPIDHRSDLFSLGSVMYAMAAGRPPFSANENLLLLKKIRETPAPGIQQFEESVPLWLANLIGWCHGKSLEDRPESASAIEQHLADWLAHLKRPDQVKAPAAVAIPSTQPADAVPPNRFRRKLLAGFAGFLFLCAAVLVIVETSTGKIRIECEGDNVPVVVKKSGQVYDKLTVNRDGATIRAFAGEYEVTFAGDFDSLSGFDLSGPDGSFALKRGKETVIRITQVNESEAASNSRSGSREDFRPVTGSDPVNTEVRLYSVGNHVSEGLFSIDEPVSGSAVSARDGVKLEAAADELISVVKETCGERTSIQFLPATLQLVVRASSATHQEIEDLLAELSVDLRNQIEIELLAIATNESGLENVDGENNEAIKESIGMASHYWISLTAEKLERARDRCKSAFFNELLHLPQTFAVETGKATNRHAERMIVTARVANEEGDIELRVEFAPQPEHYDTNFDDYFTVIRKVKSGESIVIPPLDSETFAYVFVPRIVPAKATEPVNSTNLNLPATELGRPSTGNGSQTLDGVRAEGSDPSINSDPANTELRMYSVGNYVSEALFSTAPSDSTLPGNEEDTASVAEAAAELIEVVQENCKNLKSIRFLQTSLQLVVRADAKTHQEVQDVLKSLSVDQRDHIQVEIIYLLDELVDSENEDELELIMQSPSLSAERVAQLRKWYKGAPFDVLQLKSGKTISSEFVLPMSVAARVADEDGRVQVRVDHSRAGEPCETQVCTVEPGAAMVFNPPQLLKSQIAFLIVPTVSRNSTNQDSLVRRLVHVKPQVADHVTMKVPGLGKPPWPSGRILVSDAAVYQVEVSDDNKLITTGSLEILPVTEASRVYLVHNDITVQVTSEDLKHLKEGNEIVTAMYLPKDGSRAIAGVETMVTTRIDPSKDTVAEAKKRGTLLAVLRLGGIEAQQENLTSTTTTDGDYSSEPLPTYEGKDIEHWFAWAREIEKTSPGGLSPVGFAHPDPISILSQDERNDALVLKEMNRRFAGAKRELNSKTIDLQAEVIVGIAGKRHQKRAVDILMQLADVRPIPKGFESLVDNEGNEVNVPFESAVRQLHLNRELALQISGQMKSSGRRVLVGPLIGLWENEEKDEDRQTPLQSWLRQNADVLLPAFIAGFDDPDLMAAWNCVTIAFSTRGSLEPDGLESKAKRWTRLPIDEKLEEALTKVLQSDSRVYITHFAAEMLFAIAPENPVLLETLLQWARSPDHELVVQSLDLLSEQHDTGVANLCTLLEDTEWGTAKVEPIERHGQTFTTYRTLVLGFLATSGKSGEAALEILRKEAQSPNKQQKELATKAIQSIEAALKKT